LAGGNIDAVLAELLEQPRVRDVRLMHLVEHELLESKAEVPLHVGRPSGHLQAAVGQAIHSSAIPRVVRLDLHILHDEIPIALDLRAPRQALDHQRQILVNLQLSCLLTLLRARPFALRLTRLRCCRLQQSAGLDLRPLRGPFELVNLIPQRLDFRILPPDDVQQRQHQGRLLGGRNRQRTNLDWGFRAHTPQITLKPTSE
jgi:hypothetical protein